MNFDIFPTLLGKANKIVFAKLVWNVSHDNWTPGYGPDSTVCYRALFEAKGQWKAFNTPGEFLTNWPEHTKVSSRHSVDVSHQIRRWAKGDQQYFGFFFTSTREADLPSKLNRNCETTLHSLRLEVLVNIE